jgi:hypothetical protein
MNHAIDTSKKSFAKAKREIQKMIEDQSLKNREELLQYLVRIGVIEKTTFNAPFSAIASTPEFETVGEQIGSISAPPFEFGTDLLGVRAIDLEGNQVPYYADFRRAHKQTGEFSLSLIMGQFFDILYPSHFAIPEQSFYSATNCCSLGSPVRLDRPYEEDVFIVSHTVVSLPVNEANEVFYMDRGNLNLEFCGMEGFAFTTLRTEGGSKLTRKRFLRAIQSSAGENMNEYSNLFLVENRIKLPAGNTEFNFSVTLQATNFSSKDFSNPIGLNPGNFGFAMLDLRSKVDGAYPIFSDPFGRRDKLPAGYPFCVVPPFRVHKVKSILTA